VDAIVAGGVDELDRGTAGLTPAHAAQKHTGIPLPFENQSATGAEGAACLVLASGSSKFAERPGVPRINLAGWGYAGPGSLKAAVDDALATAGIALGQLDRVFGIDRTLQWDAIAESAGLELPVLDLTAVLGNATSISAVLSAVHAFMSLRRGELHRALVISAAGTAVSTALVFTTTGGDIQ